MLLKLYNASLIRDREKTYLTAGASASATSITVSSTDLAPDAASSNTWANNDYMIVGEIGSENAEVMQMNAAVTSATSLTIDREGQSGGLRYNHSIGEPLYRIDFNQVQFYNGTSNSTTGLTTLSTINLQVDDLYTRYEDTSNTTGYGFARFKNATSGSFSSYSDGVNYDISGDSSSRDPKTLWSMRKKVRQLVDEQGEQKIDDSQIDDTINDRQRAISHLRLWSFFEIERSQSSVANQFAYDIPDRVQKIHTVRFRTQPLVNMSRRKWDELHWDTDSTSDDPSHFVVWDRKILTWPRNSSAAETGVLSGAHTASQTTVTLTANPGFTRGDYYRFTIDSETIYATSFNATTFVFSGCLRGQEGTTAATHSSAVAVTELDIVLTGNAEPEPLIDTQDRTYIPEPDVLTYGTAMDIALQLEKDTLHDRLKIKYDEGIKSLESKYATKQSAQFGRIKDEYEMIGDSTSSSINSNLYPRDIG